MKLTIREIRRMLFEIENQNLTISELRNMLYNINEKEQDNEIELNKFATIINKLIK